MALTAYLRLRANGIELEGNPTQYNVGGMDVSSFIPVVSVSHEVAVPPGTDIRLGRPVHGPVTIVKPMDGASPLIWRALLQNEQVEAELFFFGRDPNGGETQHTHTLHLEQGRVTSVVSEMLHNAYSENSPLPVYERVGLIYRTVTWTSEVNSTEYAASWDTSR